MSRNVIDSLKAWKRKPSRAMQDVEQQVQNPNVRDALVALAGGPDFELEVQASDKPSLTMILREAERSARKASPFSLCNIEEDWKPQPPSPMPQDVILCRIVELDHGLEAVCMMIADGYELPRVSFPAGVLRRKGLRVGSRFNWLVRDPGRVRLSDIDTNVPPIEEMAPVDAARLEALHAEMERGLAENGGKWPVYTGDGE